MKKVLAALAASVLNGALSVFLLPIALGVFGRAADPGSPVQVLPHWRALPVLGAGYLALGLVAALWSSRLWTVVVPALVGFFWTLGGLHFGADYYPVNLWDYLGRPTAEQAGVGLVSVGLMGAGWALAIHTIHRSNWS